jgi:hypothetical protein
MRRVYVNGWVAREPNWVEVSLGFDPEHAHPWPTRAEALKFCKTFDSYGIEVSWAEGGNYICRDFQVEEYSPQKFLLCCDGPFTLTAGVGRGTW